MPVRLIRWSIENRLLVVIATLILADGTDLYCARTRVVEYLNQSATGLPPGVQPKLV